MNQPLLRLVNISKRYPGVQALHGVDLALEAGEIHCLVGENGSGKSTLIKIMAGVVRPDAGGRLEFDGEPVRHWDSTRSMRSGVEVIYQDLSLFPNLTVAENIALGQLIEEHRVHVVADTEDEHARVGGVSCVRVSGDGEWIGLADGRLAVGEKDEKSRSIVLLKQGEGL